jgi:hypothetical protein
MVRHRQEARGPFDPGMTLVHDSWKGKVIDLDIQAIKALLSNVGGIE